MAFNSIEDILDFAIENEVKAAEFYQSAARNEETRGFRALLTDFAEEERRHERLLRAFKADRTCLPGYRFERIRSLKRSDYLVDTPYRPGMNYVQIIRVAMKREEKSNRLYEELALSTDNIEQASFLMRLAQEELRHKKALETSYDDYMARQGD
jgi:rubrerythrin